MFERIIHMMRKEFIQAFRDLRMRFLIFVAPVIQLLIFGYAVNTDVRNITTAVEDFDNSTVDPLVELAESLLTFLYMRQLADQPEAVFLSANLSPIMSAVHADDFSVFTSVITVRYKVMQKL